MNGTDKLIDVFHHGVAFSVHTNEPGSSAGSSSESETPYYLVMKSVKDPM
jgi:hypothetical protein